MEIKRRTVSALQTKLLYLVAPILLLPNLYSFPLAMNTVVPNRTEPSHPSPPTTPERRVSLIQWNCRSISTNLDQFTQFLHSLPETPSLLCLQSLNVRKQGLPTLKDYYYPPFFSLDGNKVRTATYVKNTLQVSPCQKPGDFFGNACEVTLSNKETLTVVNVYFPRGCVKTEDTHWLTTLPASKCLVVGDFNAHHSMWGGAGTASSGGGQLLADHLIASDLCLLNDCSATRVPDHNRHKPTAIDISMISSSLYSSTEWEVCTDTLGSDHFPIQVRLNDVSPSCSMETELKYNYKKANWEAFRRCLDNADYHVEASVTVDEQYEALRRVILAAANKAIPRKRQKPTKFPPNPWWNSQCEEAVRRKRRAFTRYKRTPTEGNYNELKVARIQCKKAIAEAKRDHWAKFISNKVTDYKDTKTLWQKVKNVRGKYRPAQRPLSVNGVRTTSDYEKAEALAQIFAEASRSDTLSPEQQAFRRQEDLTHQEPIPDHQAPMNADLTMMELTKCINGIKSVKKACGSDPISYAMIQKFPQRTLSALLALFQRCWDQGTVPSSWKHATVISILKQGKPASNPSSYRPISLTPHVCKLFERMVKVRLDFHLNKHGIIPATQAGFRRGRGCSDHLVKLTAHVKRALAKRKTVLSTFYDVRRAYDTVWHGRLLRKLAGVGVNGKMFNFCRSFLRDRSFAVKAGSALSRRRETDMGLPQGSIVAPTFFSVMLYDIQKVKLQNAQTTLFADDLALWSQENYKKLSSKFVRKVILKRFQHNVNQIVHYMNENGFDLSPEKTVFMIFSRSKFTAKDYSITINDIKINPSQQVKYLGLIIDDKLKWSSHIEQLLSKTNPVWNIIKALKNVEGACHVKNIVQVVGALVRSRLSYGQEAFFAASRASLAKLQTRECRFLRYALNMGNSVPQDVVYREVGWLPLQFHRKLCVAQYAARANVVENSTKDELELEFDPLDNARHQKNRRAPRTEQNLLPIAQFIKDTFSSANVSRDSIQKSPDYLIPPWQLAPLNVAAELGGGTKKDNELLLSLEAKTLIHQDLINDFLIFTDGSKLDDGRVGGAFHAPGIQITKSFRLTDNTSIFSAELYSIYKALLYVVDLPPIHNITILSDSKSSLQSLLQPKNNRRDIILEIQLLVDQLRYRGSMVRFQWIPSHVGIAGNEAADIAAKTGARLPWVTDDIGLSAMEANSRLKHAVWEEWSRVYHDRALNKDWIEPHVIREGTYPPFPEQQLFLFYRLRGKTFQSRFSRQKCSCKTDLTYSHIFSCPRIDLSKVVRMANTNDLPLNPKNLLTKHDSLGWSLCGALIRALFFSEIGHLL